MRDIIQYAKQEIKDGFLKSYWIENEKIYAESTQGGIFIYWEEEQEKNPSTIYGE